MLKKLQRKYYIRYIKNLSNKCLVLQETPLSAEDVSLWSDPQDNIMVQDDIIELPSIFDSNTDKEEAPITNNAPTTKSEVHNKNYLWQWLQHTTCILGWILLCYLYIRWCCLIHNTQFNYGIRISERYVAGTLFH